MKNLWMKLIVAVIAIMLGYCAHIISKKNDSPLEQAAEAILQSQGIDIDFSLDDTE